MVEMKSKGPISEVIEVVSKGLEDLMVVAGVGRNWKKWKPNREAPGYRLHLGDGVNTMFLTKQEI